MREGFNTFELSHLEKGVSRWGNAYRWRMKNDYDCVCVFTGPEGVGKSTLSYETNSILDRTFNARMRTGFGTPQAIEISQRLPPGKIVEMDEGIEGLLNRDAMKTENKEWQKWMVISRQKNLGVSICFPRFRSLDLYMREFRVWTWFHVIKRGFAWIRVRNWNISPEEDSPHYYTSYPAVAAVEFPDVPTFAQSRDWVDLEDWKHKQEKKKEYIASFSE